MRFLGPSPAVSAGTCNGGGWLTRDAESSHLTLDREDTVLDHLLGHSITYRIAVGTRAGQRAFTLRSLPGTPLPQPSQPFLASADGFSLHAGVAAGADERKKAERLCRYIARPAIAEGRLSLTGQGHVRYTLKTPYRDGTSHMGNFICEMLWNPITRETGCLVVEADGLQIFSQVFFPAIIDRDYFPRYLGDAEGKRFLEDRQSKEARI